MTVLAVPNLSLTVTPPGGSAVDLAHFLAWSGAQTPTTISSNFGRQGDTATIVLVDDYNAVLAGFPNGVGPHFSVPPFSTIELKDLGAESQPAGGIIFTGLVTDPQWRWTAPGRVEWLLQCVDFTYYADTSIVKNLYSGISADNIMVDITTQADCGITAKLVRDGGHVYPGPLIPLINFTEDKLSSHWTDLTKLASQAEIYGWFVDTNREVWFYPTTKSFFSGVTVTDVLDTKVPSIGECHIDPTQPMTFEWDGTTFYTRAVVLGASITREYDVAKARKGTIPATDAWVGDGVQSSWPMSYVPQVTSTTLKAAAGIISRVGATTITGAPYLSVNGVAQGAMLNDGTVTITTPFQIVQANNGLWTLQVTPGVGSVPASGAQIKLWYRYQFPITAVANLPRQQEVIGGPNRGVFTTLVKDPSLTSSTAAYQRAVAQLQEYGAPQERLTFYTSPDWLGWFRCGQTFQLSSNLLPDSQNAYKPGLSARFFVIQQMVTFKPGGLRSTQVTATRMV